MSNSNIKLKHGWSLFSLSSNDNYGDLKTSKLRFHYSVYEEHDKVSLNLRLDPNDLKSGEDITIFNVDRVLKDMIGHLVTDLRKRLQEQYEQIEKVAKYTHNLKVKYYNCRGYKILDHEISYTDDGVNFRVRVAGKIDTFFLNSNMVTIDGEQTIRGLPTRVFNEGILKIPDGTPLDNVITRLAIVRIPDFNC